MKLYRYLIVVVLSFILVACGQADKSADNRVAYVEASSSSSAMVQKQEDKTPEQVAAEEGNHAEQVVVKITADGYVTSHGDHYHFYNGQVGYDALFSRELLVADDYVFDPSQVVVDVAEGHVVKVGEDYYLYVTAAQPQHLRD